MRKHDLLFTSDWAAARISVFRCSDEQLLGQVEVGPHPNGLAYDRSRRRLYAFNLGEPPGETAPPPSSTSTRCGCLASRRFRGGRAGRLCDAERDRVDGNIREPAEIVVIDCAQVAIQRSLPVPAAGRRGLWLDRGEQLETVATEQGAHTLGWDPDGRRLCVFCPGRGGALVLEERA